MKKSLIFQFVILFTCFTIASTHAQDSVKKAPVAKPTVTNPYNKYKYKLAVGVYTSRVADSTKAAIVAAKPAAPTDNSLNGQYQYLLTKVYFYQQPLLNAFHKSITDTLNLARKNLKASQSNLVVANKTIDSLQTSIKANTQSLSESNEKVNEVSLIGIPVTKATYNLIMWGLVIIFGVVAAIVIARSGASTREAKYRTQLYSELEEEYRVYKAKAVEKEKKMARELQTERNKIDELLGRG
jgi:flagellar motility protein MotE (MotC chaperone)